MNKESKKIAFGDNFKRFSQWYGKVFYTFLYHKKGVAQGFLSSLYAKLFKINDTPQKIALGFGIGVFSGIMPGIGPLAALFLAFILKANRASALFGSMITNTWLSVLTFALSIKTGSVILRTDWQKVYSDWVNFLAGFHWAGLLRLSVLKILLPVITGYAVVSFVIGLSAYIIILVILKIKSGNKHGDEHGDVPPGARLFNNKLL